MLSQLRIGRRQPCREVRRGGPGTGVETVHDLVEQDVARPPVFGRCCGVPVALDLVGGLVQQHRDVSPGKLSSSLLDNWIWPRLGEEAHVEQVAAGESAHRWKLRVQIGGEALDYRGAPPFGLLPGVWPMRQYNCTNSVLTTRWARHRASATVCSSSWSGWAYQSGTGTLSLLIAWPPLLVWVGRI